MPATGCWSRPSEAIALTPALRTGGTTGSASWSTTWWPWPTRPASTASPSPATTGAPPWRRALAARHPERISALAALSVPHPRAFRSALAGSQLLRSWYMVFFQLPRVPERILSSPLAVKILERSGLDTELAVDYLDHLRAPGAFTRGAQLVPGPAPRCDRRRHAGSGPGPDPVPVEHQRPVSQPPRRRALRRLGPGPVPLRADRGRLPLAAGDGGPPGWLRSSWTTSPTIPDGGHRRVSRPAP